MDQTEQPRRPAAWWRGVAVLAGLATLVGGAAVVPARAAAPAGAPGADATLGALISGTGQYVGGTYVWTDYAYDDRGPDTDDTAGGDATYPDPATNNAADLIQLHLAPAEGGVTATAVLESLTAARRPVIGIALDSDGDPATGAPSLPGSWPASGLGVDHLFVLARGGGTVERWDGEAWAAAGSVAVEVDDAANTVAALLPFALPATGTLRAVSVLGYETGETSWRTGEVPVHDLAFVTAGSPAIPYLESVTTAVTGFGGDGEKQWQEYEQSAILAGNAAPGPDGAGVAEIDVAKLQAGATELAAPDAKGFHTFLYRSSIDLGEGVEGSGNGAVYNGPYQPYLVWVPGKDRLKPGLPLVLYLHGSSQTHLSAVNVAHYDPASQQAGRPDAIFDFDAVVAWPLGRGPQTWYEGPAELDPLEVADDVVARLALDRDRVMLAGLSMGGYGTFRLAERYPDRWSVAYVDVAGDEVGLVENLTALPVRMQNGVADPLIPLKELSEGNDPTWRRTQGLLAAAGTVDYRSWVLTTGTHGPAIAVAECVYRESFDRPRVTNPMQVRYTVDPTSFVDDPASGLRLVYEGAYWVSGMRAAADDQPGSVDLVTRAFTTLPPATPPPVTDTAHENLTHAEDFCGTDTTVRTRQSWMEQARRIVPVANPVPERIVTGTLSGLSAVTVAADRAGLGGRAPASLRLTVVGPAAVDLTITGLASGSAVTAAGRTVRADGSGVATVPLPAGGPGPVTVTIR